MVKFQSCSYIEHGMVLDHCNRIRVCNNFNPRYGGRPVIYENYKGEKINWSEFFAFKRQLRNQFRQNSCPLICTNCVNTSQKEWDDEDYIDYLLLTPWIKCNSKCVYCQAPRDKYVIENTKEYKVFPVIKDMIKNNILKKDGTIDFAGGEPTIYCEFEKMLNEFIKNDFKNIIVHTNAIKKSGAVLKGIKKGVVNVLVSIDAGSREIHERVKQVKSYDIVWKNLKEYAKNQPDNKSCVRTKYIIIPNLNDKESEIDLWLQKSKEIGINNVVLNLDFNWIMENVDNDLTKVYQLMNYTLDKSKELGLECNLYGQIYQVKYEVEKHKNKDLK